MRLVLPLAVMLLPSHLSIEVASAQVSAVPSISGDWHGELSPAPGASIPLILRIRGELNKWTATLDSPMQGANGLRVETVSQRASRFRFVLTAPQAEYEATLSADGKVLSGTWHQGGGSLPLTMVRKSKA